MHHIEIFTDIHAPIERVFDLSMSLDLHMDSVSHTKERAVAGKTSGIIGLNETVTWEAVHLGVRQRLTSKITEVNWPYFFEDVQVKGAFKWFTHKHYFKEADGTTNLRDTFDFEAPLGILGKIASWLVVKRHMEKFLIARNNAIKRVAESEHDWKKYISA
jgi:ligand-binding SRPBCC domain-containing protein